MSDVLSEVVSHAYVSFAKYNYSIIYPIGNC